MTDETWRPLFERAVHAFYEGDLAGGREASERLLGRDDLPAAVRLQARRNQTFYAPCLRELAPSVITSSIAVEVPTGWSCFNPSIAADDGGFGLIVRSSNYSVARMRYTVHDADGIFRTTNYLLHLDDDLAVRAAAPLVDQTDRRSVAPFPVAGYEDCRLVRGGDGWRVVATTRDRNPAGICQMALRRLADGALRDLRLLNDAANERHQKNWVPLLIADELRFVAHCRPTVILRYDERRGAVEEMSRRPGPMIATDFRGGSQAVAVDSGFLFVVHESVDLEDGGRVVPHRFVLLDHRAAIAAVSPQFFFDGRGLEFCAGLARRGDRLVASYGVEDREARLAEMSLAEVLPLLDPVAVAVAVATAPRSAAAPIGAQGSRQPAVPPAAPSGGTTPFGAAIVSVTLAGSGGELIGEALASVADWVDACLVVDTGDGADAVAAARAVVGDKVRVRSFPWRDDFAAARNFGLEAAAAAGAAWAVILDTDERLTLRGTAPRRLLAASEADILFVPSADGTYAKERFFRLPARGRFVGPTHEYFAAEEAVVGSLAGATFAEVAKSPEAYCRKFERDAAILARHVETFPDEPRWRYYLGDALQNLGRHAEAITAYEACAALAGWDEEAAWSRYRAAECWLALGDPVAAVGSCAAGMAHHAGLAELPWLAAFASWRAGRPRQAIHWARLAIAAGCFEGTGREVPRLGFRYPPALYEGPYDVLRFALPAVGDAAGGDDAERLYHAARAARGVAGRLARHPELAV